LLIYGLAFVLALPTMPKAAELLHALWTRREVMPPEPTMR
jgi:hypothetical protein